VRDGFGFLAPRHRVEHRKKDLTRRANQLHIFIIATSLSPRREIGGGLFQFEWLHSQRQMVSMRRAILIGLPGPALQAVRASAARPKRNP
jgi:hypothetical protein